MIGNGDKAQHWRGDRQRDQRRADRNRPEQAWLRRKSANHLAQRGGTTLVATASRTLSGVWPPTSASGRRMSRWRKAGARSAFTWSGVTKSEPSNAASALAASMSRTSALVLAPSAISGALRVADASSTTYRRIVSLFVTFETCSRQAPLVAGFYHVSH